MKRRDTERDHAYAHEVFNALKIFDIQGLLKEGDIYKSGIEAYQVSNFNQIKFDLLRTEEEIARFHFCQQLNIPYLIIVVSEYSNKYRIYNTVKTENSVQYLFRSEYSATEFITWWRSQQSFTQKKGMYDAGPRIKDSMIDELLFKNSLAWGVNVDGFDYDLNTKLIKTIYEKRICTNSSSYTIFNYDPNKYFHGTASRSGDYPSWIILYDLSKRFNASLILFTFDTSTNKNIGATKIINISEQGGLTYQNNTKPYNNIFNNNIQGLKAWIVKNM